MSSLRVPQTFVTNHLSLRLGHLLIPFDQDNMAEKLCLQWNNFKENVNSAFGKLRDNKEFTDVTLVCEDGQQIESHKVILASSSPFFEKIIKKSKHPHPLIFLRGFQSKDFASILDFLYFGEANVYQEDLDSFLAIAEDIKLKGLTGQTSSDLLEDQEQPKHPETMPRHSEPAKMSTELFLTSSSGKRDLTSTSNTLIKPSKEIAIPNQLSGDLQALDEKVKSMMEKGQRMIPKGKQANGASIQATSSICKVCGKEGLAHHIRDHIEAHHLEGISLPCDHCDKNFSSRVSLRMHNSRFHK